MDKYLHRNKQHQLKPGFIKFQFIMCSVLHGQVPSMWKVKRSTTKYYRRHVSCMQLGRLNSYFCTIRVACKDLVKHMLCMTGMANIADVSFGERMNPDRKILDTRIAS